MESVIMIYLLHFVFALLSLLRDVVASTASYEAACPEFYTIPIHFPKAIGADLTQLFILPFRLLRKWNFMKPGEGKLWRIGGHA